MCALQDISAGRNRKKNVYHDIEYFYFTIKKNISQYTTKVN